MKTGGTMNFLKRAGAILMVVAIFASSCNKYADDFKQLNTKLDALATQVAGVTSLVTDMGALKSQVTALQTAVAGLPGTASITALQTSLTAVSGKVDALTTTLNTVAAAGTATKAVVDGLKTDLAALVASQATANAAATAAFAAESAKLTALDTKATGIVAQLTAIGLQETALATAVANNNTAIAANATALVALAAQQTALAGQLTALAAATSSADAIAVATAATNAATAATANAALAAQAAQILTDLTANTTADAATALVITGLQTSLAAQKLQLDQIILNTSMYNGDVSITTDAEVTFFLAKIAQLGIINGNLTVDKTLISAGQLTSVNTITNKITNVIGTGVVIVNFKQGDAIDLSKLVSVKGAMTVTGTAKGAGADIDLSVLNSVGGTLTLNYDGPYTSTTLRTVGGDLDLVNKAVVAATTPLGTTSINIPSVTVAGKVGDVVGVANGIVTYPLATDVILAGGVSSVTAAKATNIKLGSTTYAGALTVSSSATAAATIDLSAATNITGAASITGFGATAVNLSGLKTAPAGITVTTGATGTVDLTAFNEPVGVLTVAGPKTLVLPAMVAGTIVANTAETVTLAKLDWVIAPTLGAVKYLTLGAANRLVALAGYPTVITASITGKTVTTIPLPTGLMGAVSATVANAALTTVSVAGSLESVNLNTIASLTSVTTSGVVNSFTINACSNAALTALTLGHTHYEGGPGSTVVVTGNTKLTSLTTSTDKMAVLTVTGNTALAAANFASYVTKTVSGNPAISISANALTGSYTNGIAATITTPYVECTITSAALSSLKAYVALYTAPVLAIDLDAVKIGAGAATLLSVKMFGDTDAKLQWAVAPAGTMGVDDAGAWPAATAGINNKVEMAHVL